MNEAYRNLYFERGYHSGEIDQLALIRELNTA